MKRQDKQKETDVEISQDEDLPAGWKFESLGEGLVLGIQPGFACGEYNREGSGIAQLRPMNVHESGRIDLSLVKYVPEARVSRQELILVKGDVLFNNTNSPELVGKTAYYDLTGPATFSNHMTRIRCNTSALDPKYCAMALHQKWREGYFKTVCNNHVSQSSVSRSVLLETPLPVPPVPEQKRIVAKIEELLPKVNVVRERLIGVKEIMKRFRQSVLSAACSGRLTEVCRVKDSAVEDASQLLERIRESFEKEGASHGGQAAGPTEGIHELSKEQVPESWNVAPLKWLCVPRRPITYGILKPGPDQSDGIPYIRVADFPKNFLEQSKIRKTTPTIAAQYERSSLRAGDVLLSIRGTVGRVCRVPNSLEGSNITQDTARISVHPEICPEYIEIYLKCPVAQKTLEKAMKGVAVRGVNIGDVRELQVAIPPKTEQEEIVQLTDQLLKMAERIERRVEIELSRTEKMTQAILAKAFRGDLVHVETELSLRERQRAV